MAKINWVAIIATGIGIVVEIILLFVILYGKPVQPFLAFAWIGFIGVLITGLIFLIIWVYQYLRGQVGKEAENRVLTTEEAIAKSREILQNVYAIEINKNKTDFIDSTQQINDTMVFMTKVQDRHANCKYVFIMRMSDLQFNEKNKSFEPKYFTMLKNPDENQIDNWVNSMAKTPKRISRTEKVYQDLMGTPIGKETSETELPQSDEIKAELKGGENEGKAR